LDEAGVTGQDRIVGISQGWKLTGAIKTAERKLADGSLRHSGQRLMFWAVANARVEPKGNAIIITKQASGTAKIDPLMAAFNAIAPMAMNPASTQRTWAFI
jgi:phage terminase large subunit-like protein